VPDTSAATGIATEPSAYRLETDLGNIDLFRFRERVSRAHAQLEAGRTDAAREELQGGLQLWRGYAFADINSAAILTRSAHLNEENYLAWERYFDLELQLGHHHGVMAQISQLAAEHPYREKLVRQRMIALYRCGRPAEALQEYGRLRDLLASELGIDTDRETEQTYVQILNRDPLLDASIALPAKDQLPDPANFGIKPAQLPPDVAHFVGRADEIRTLDLTLHNLSSDHRTVLVTGPPGIGKTALAIRWAYTAKREFPDGQIYLDLRGHDRENSLGQDQIIPYLIRCTCSAWVCGVS
jgi:hypothetical protein